MKTMKAYIVGKSHRSNDIATEAKKKKIKSSVRMMLHRWLSSNESDTVQLHPSSNECDAVELHPSSEECHGVEAYQQQWMP